MGTISKIDGVAAADIAKVDGIAKAAIVKVNDQTLASAPATENWEFFFTNNTGSSEDVAGFQTNQNAGASMTFASATAVNPPMNLGIVSVNPAGDSIIVFDFLGGFFAVAATTQVKVLTIVMSDTSSDIPNASTAISGFGGAPYSVATRVNGVVTDGDPASDQFTADYVQL